MVYRSAPHLDEAELRAMAVLLTALPQSDETEPPAAPAAEPAQLAPGAQLYAKHCVQCHGKAGQGAVGAYPALAPAIAR